MPDPTVARHFNFPKVNDPTILEFYGNIFCLDKSTRSPSFKVQIVAEQELQIFKKSQNFCTSGARANDSEGVQSIGTRMGLGASQKS